MAFNENIPQLTIKTQNHADNFNNVNGKLLENDKYLKEQLEGKIKLNGEQTNVNFIKNEDGKVSQINANGELINLAGEKGSKGEPGTASVAIDDDVTNAVQTWTSQKIKDIITTKVKEGLDTVNSDRALNVFGFNKRFLKDRFGFYSINLFGDSISQGYNSSDHFKKSYGSLLRYAIQNEYDTTNIGFVNVHPTGYYQELTTTGEWTNVQNYDVLGNQKLSSTDTNGKVTIKPKFKQKYFSICYEQKPDNGAFDVSINGVVVATIDCNGELDYCKKTQDFIIPMSNTYGTIEIIKKDNKPTSISGIWYFDDKEKVVFNNYSRSGATLSDMSTHVLDCVCDCNIILMALNHNDTASRVTEYTNKINYIRDIVKGNKVFTVLLDFKWTEKNNAIKNEMIRVYNEMILSNYPVLYYDMGKELWQNELYYMQKYGFLANGDNSHPTDTGHKVLAEGLCKILNIRPIFSTLVSSEWHNVGEESDVAFENSWRNSLENVYTRYRKVNGIVFVEFYVVGGVLGQRVFRLPKDYCPKITFREITTMFEESGVLKYQRCEINMDGSIILTTNQESVGHLYGVVSFSV